MKTKMAGAALAAVMGACALVGGVERAEAALVTVSAGGPDLFDGLSWASFNFYTTGGFGKGSYTIYYYGTDNLDYRYTINSSEVTGTIVTGKQCHYLGNCVSYDITAIFNNYTVSDYTAQPGNPRPLPDIGFYAVHQEVQYNRDGTFVTAGGPNNGFDLIQYGASANVAITPLPQSALLMGASLMALGGLGYARRRMASV